MLASYQPLLGNAEATAFVDSLGGRSVSIIIKAALPHRNAKDVQ